MITTKAQSITIGPKPSPFTKVDYKNQLNEQQYKAVITNGPALVIAGAGTGKTRVLVHRVSYLIEKGIAPREILLLTFTKKAATEMMDRVSILLRNNSGSSVAGGTFHSFANNILRKYANLLEIPVNFNILDNSDSEDVIDKIRTDMGYNKSKSAFPRKGRIFEIISTGRNKGVSIEDVVKTEYTGLTKLISDIEKISKQYAIFKNENALFDFDDLIEVFVDSLKKNRLFRKLVSRQYKYILVDEFQDTNNPQMELVTWLANEGHRNIMVVGDDMQSIYAFRGANYQNIIQFPKLFSDCKIIKLEQNYRSQPALLNFTNETIKNAPEGFKKRLWSDKSTGSKPIAAKLFDAQEEAEFVVDEILELRENNIPLEQIAVLVRASWNSNAVQLELEKRAIPYIVVGGIKFTERKHVKDVIAYLKIAHNLQDRVAWHRVLKLLPGIGPKTADKIINWLENGGKVQLDLFNKVPTNKQLQQLGKVLVEISDDKVLLPDKIEAISKHYLPILEAVDVEADIKKLDIEMIQERSAAYESIEKFLSDFVLNPPSKKMAKQIDPLIDETEEKPVTVSTIHSAKGLEWHTVFVIHALEGILPSIKATTEDEVEEERRLFYVACSRAKEGLFITRPSFLPIYTGYIHQQTRFVGEIPENQYNKFENNKTHDIW